MRCDAKWIGAFLNVLPADQISPLLNIGSGDRSFREMGQAYIEQDIFAPLCGRGVKVIHSDLGPGDGIDVVGNIIDDADYARIRALQPKTVLCTHVIEHVPIDQRDAFARRLQGLVPKDGFLIVSVPSSYHEHGFDTMFRPTPNDLLALFSGNHLLAATELKGETYWPTLARRPVIILRHLIRFLAPFAGMKSWKRSMRKLYWLFNPYKVSVVALRKA